MLNWCSEATKHLTSFGKALFTSALAFSLFAAASDASNPAIITYDIVVLNGRVIDPESKLDAVRNLGIADGKIKNISRQTIKGRRVIDARGVTAYNGENQRLSESDIKFIVTGD